MAKILSDVRTATRAILDETTAADWTNIELNKLINARYHRIVTAVANVFEDYYLTTDTFNTTASQQEYGSADGVATDIYKIRRVEVNFSPSGNSAPTRCLPISTIDVVRRDLSYTNAGLSVTNGANYYTYGFGSNFKIGFIPIPSETGTAAGKIWYVAQKADLSSDADNIDIPYADRYYYMIVEGAAADALRFGQQESAEADKLDIKFEANLAKMMEELEDKVAEEGKSIMDVQGTDINFEF